MADPDSSDRDSDFDRSRDCDHDNDNDRSRDSDRADPSREDDPPVVALDASLLMGAVEVDLRPFEAIDRLVPGARRVVPEAVIEELDSLSGRGGEAGTAAGVARELADRCRIVAVGSVVDSTARDRSGPAGDAESTDLPPVEEADDALVALAAAGRVDYVATLDRELRDRLLRRSVPVIGLSGGHKLAVTRP